MPRRQIILFSILVIISIIFLLLNEPTTLALSSRLSSVLLYPVKTTTEFLEFLTISSKRIEKLEIMLNELRLENAELKDKIPVDTVDFKITEFKLLKAKITGRDPANINGYLYIDKGKKQGVYVNQPVISVNGLIGKIKFVNTYSSIVETFENQGFAVSALDTKTGIHGIIKQSGSLMFDYIRITDEINIGDSIYSSGMSGIFRAGILIGKVRDIQHTDDLFFKKVYVSPRTQINRITSVYLLFGGEAKRGEQRLESIQKK